MRKKHYEDAEIIKQFKEAISAYKLCMMEGESAVQAANDHVMSKIGISPLEFFNVDLKANREKKIYKLIKDSKTKGVFGKKIPTDQLWIDWDEDQIKEALISLEDKCLIQKISMNDIDYQYFATCNIPSEK